MEARPARLMNMLILDASEAGASLSLPHTARFAPLQPVRPHITPQPMVL